MVCTEDYSVLIGNKEKSNPEFAEELGDVYQPNSTQKEEKKDYLN